MRQFLLVSYFYSRNDGVGGARAECLSKVLQSSGYDVELISRNTFGNDIAAYNLLWAIKCLLRVLFSKAENVYLTCGPFWHLPFVLMALAIKKKYFIFDLRDSWSLNIVRSYGGTSQKSTSSITRYLSEYIEKKTYQACDEFWVCTPGMVDGYTALFGDGSKIKLVLNGHDLSEIYKDSSIQDLVNNKQKNDQLKLVCIGKFAEYGEEKAQKVFDVMKAYVEAKKSDVQLFVIGANPEVNNCFVEKQGMANYVKIMPAMPYKDAINFASQADYGICIIRDEEIDFGTKVFDYIAIGLPIVDVFDEQSAFKKYFSNYIYNLFDNSSYKWALADFKQYSREQQLQNAVSKI